MYDNEFSEGLGTLIVLIICFIPVFIAMYKEWKSNQELINGNESPKAIDFWKDFFAGRLK